jgi:hypothetical protein
MEDFGYGGLVPLTWGVGWGEKKNMLHDDGLVYKRTQEYYYIAQATLGK